MIVLCAVYGAEVSSVACVIYREEMSRLVPHWLPLDSNYYSRDSCQHSNTKKREFFCSPLE